jgi:hypothetical protein
MRTVQLAYNAAVNARLCRRQFKNATAVTAMPHWQLPGAGPPGFPAGGLDYWSKLGLVKAHIFDFNFI